MVADWSLRRGFPFLFGRAFIEAEREKTARMEAENHFPSFLEGLSLRLDFYGTDPADVEGISLPFWKGFH